MGSTGCALWCGDEEVEEEVEEKEEEEEVMERDIPYTPWDG